MAIQFREGWLNFGPVTGRRQRESTTVNFSSRVRSHQVMMKGFNVQYNNGDHHILELEIDLDSSVDDDVVKVDGDFVFRDSSGNFDDPYSGWINFVVVADVA
jgi:hypothetical protein